MLTRGNNDTTQHLDHKTRLKQGILKGASRWTEAFTSQQPFTSAFVREREYSFNKQFAPPSEINPLSRIKLSGCSPTSNRSMAWLAGSKSKLPNSSFLHISTRHPTNYIPGHSIPKWMVSHWAMERGPILGADFKGKRGTNGVRGFLWELPEPSHPKSLGSSVGSYRHPPGHQPPLRLSSDPF